MVLLFNWTVVIATPNTFISHISLSKGKITAIVKEKFGQTSKGEDIFKYTLSNKNNIKISILNFGCIIYEILLPDKDGNVVDVNVGFDNVKDYEGNFNYFGALCGRVANRISNAKFEIDGKTWELSKNDDLAGHICHGGFVGFSRRVWTVSIEGEDNDELVMSYVDPHLSEGFPGEVTMHVTYTLDDDNVLKMDYNAATTQPTVIDVGSHFMVNLAGHGNGKISDHVVQIASDEYLEMKDFLPTGKKIKVDDDTIMDFRKPRDLKGDMIDRLSGDCGFHHPFVFDKHGQKKFIARVEHPENKRFMEVYSTNTTVFAYGNHFMEIIQGDKKCKDDVVYKQYCAIEFLPMGYPNSINTPEFPSSIVRPPPEGKGYHEISWYKFGVIVKT